MKKTLSAAALAALLIENPNPGPFTPPKRAPLEGAVRNPRAVVSARIAQLFEDARAFCAETDLQRDKRSLRRMRRRYERASGYRATSMRRRMHAYEGVRL